MYKVKYHKRVLKFLSTQELKVKKRILSVINELKINPFQNTLDIKPFKGFDNHYRLRIGNIRMIYKVNENEILIEIIDIGYRGDIYK